MRSGHTARITWEHNDVTLLSEVSAKSHDITTLVIDSAEESMAGKWKVRIQDIDTGYEVATECKINII